MVLLMNQNRLTAPAVASRAYMNVGATPDRSKDLKASVSPVSSARRTSPPHSLTLPWCATEISCLTKTAGIAVS